jgi:hypothetical protein
MSTGLSRLTRSVEIAAAIAKCEHARVRDTPPHEGTRWCAMCGAMRTGRGEWVLSALQQSLIALMREAAEEAGG